MVRLTDRPDMTMDGKTTKQQQQSSVLENVVSVSEHLYFCQQLLYYDIVLAGPCTTDDLPRTSEAHCYTKRHAKII